MSVVGPAAAGAAAFPPPLDALPSAAGAPLLDVLAARARAEPFHVVATAIFLLAVLHTFLARRFRALAHAVQHRHDERCRAAGREPEPSVAAEVLHFFGEVE